jgi:soluble lytic murein transglycosylase-like protein
MKFSTGLAGKYWWVLILTIPLLVSYDNNPKVINQKTATVVLPPATVDWARYYAGRFDISKDLADAIIGAADSTGLSREIAFNLVRVESSFRSNAVSSAGAVGLTQVLPSTGAIYGATYRDLLDIDKNLVIGFTYLMDLYNQYEDIGMALAAYNAGPTRINSMVSMGKAMPTRYINKVLGD